MPRINEDGHILISYDTTSRDNYWRKLSEHIISIYGQNKIRNRKLVKQILLDAFDFLIKELKEIIGEEKGFGFYLYVFWLHEQSIELYFKQLEGYKLKKIDKSEFARYRRILKLILEQGCDLEFEWPQKPTSQEVLRMDKKIQDILYLGCWAYHLADNIAYQRMIEDCYFIFFDEGSFFGVDYKYHYGQAYEVTVKTAVKDYSKGTMDQDAMLQLATSLKNCLSVDFAFSRHQIQEIKKFHSPDGSILQTIEPYVLPLNLEANGTPKDDAELYYKGLTITRNNKLPLEEVIRRPYSMERYFFRPVLVYTIEGVARALVTLNKFDESFMVIATNAIHWNAMPAEWLQKPCLRDFMNLKGNEHDKILENEIALKISKLQLPFDQNIESILRPGQNNLNIVANPGEIDFIIVNSVLKKIFIGEAKYNRARYEGVGYSADYPKFLVYEKKLTDKVKWAYQNIVLIQDHLKIKNGLQNLNLQGYTIEGIFLINTPTFYMFNGKFKAITLNKIEGYLAGTFDYPSYHIETDDMQMIFNHPYFKKPLSL